MTFIKEEHLLFKFEYEGCNYVVAAVSGHPYSTPRCYVVKTNSKGKYIEAPNITKYGDYETKSEKLYLN